MRAELVVLTHQGRQAADDLQVLCGADAGAARAEQSGGRIRHGDDLERGQRIVERHHHRGATIGIELHGRVPQQQCLQQLTRTTLASTATGRNGLATIVAPANDFHLRSRGFHAPGAALQHRVQQVPAAVGHQFQQSLVYGGKRHFGVGGGLTIGQLDLNGDLGLAAHSVAIFVSLDADIQLVGLGADSDFGHTQAEGGFAQIHQRGGGHVFAALVPERGPPFARRLVAPGEEAVPRHLAQAAAQDQYAHIHVGSPAVLDLQTHGGVLAVQLHHLGFDNALALHGHQSGGEAERHAHLELGGLARLVALLFGQEIDAVGVLAAKPELTLLGHIHAGSSLDTVACRVLGGDHQFDFTGFGKTGFAQQQAARITLAAAHRTQFLDRGLVVIGIEATHHALARSGDDAGCGLDLQRHIDLWLARQVQRQRLELDFLATTTGQADPTFGLDACHDRRGPKGLCAADGLHLAIGVGVGGLQQQVLRLTAGGHLVHGDLAGAVLVQGQRQLVGNDACIGRGVGIFFAVRTVIAVAPRCLEVELRKIGVVQVFSAHQRRHAHREVGCATASYIVNLHIHRHRLHVHQCLLLGRRDAAF